MLTPLLPPALDAALNKAILQKHAGTVPDGYLATESHIVVGEFPLYLDGPPLDEYDEITLHVYYLHQLFDVSGDHPVEHTGIYQEAAISFEKDEEGNYIEKGFYRPQYSAEYIEELAPFLALGNENIAKHQQQYAEQLRNNCRASAETYIKSRNNADSIPVTDYGMIIDSVSYDIDGDGKDDACTLTYGQTSGVFSFNLTVNGKTAPYVLRGHYNLSFEIAENGKLRIRGERSGDHTDIIYLDIIMNNGQAILESGEAYILIELQ